MTDALSRFVEAQRPVLDDVRHELRAGRKLSHWMWFVFPQLIGLAHSATARYFALHSLAEAQSYLGHTTLGPRLAECTALVNQVSGRSVLQIFGTPDNLKFHSCMTLFMLAQPGASVFQDAIGKYFGGVPDEATIKLLR